MGGARSAEPIAKMVMDGARSAEPIAKMVMDGVRSAEPIAKMAMDGVRIWRWAPRLAAQNSDGFHGLLRNHAPPIAKPMIPPGSIVVHLRPSNISPQ